MGRQYVTALSLAKSKRERENGTAATKSGGYANQSEPEVPKKGKVCKPYVSIMACTDCGFGTAAGANNLSRDLVFKKIAAMCKGAKLLEEELAAEEAEKKEGKPSADSPGPI